MIKAAVFVVACCVLVAFAADDESYGVWGLRPKNNAIVNDCPSFSWAPRGLRMNYNLVIKKGNSLIHNITVKTPSLSLINYGQSSFLQVGTYTWFVEASDGTRSKALSFNVPALSCLPPRSSNKMDNNGGKKFIDFHWKDQSGQIDPSLTEVRAFDDHYDVPVNDSYNRHFYAYPGESMMAVLMMEHTQPQASDIFEANFSAKFNPDIGDNLLVFRYAFWTTGNSTFSVEYDDEQKKTHYLGCIGSKINDNGIPTGVCDGSTKDIRKDVMNQGFSDAKWGLFVADIPPAENDHIPVVVRWRFIRGLRDTDDGYEALEKAGKKPKNVLLFISELTFGQCSSVRRGYYDTYNCSDNSFDPEKCFWAADAGFMAPGTYKKNYMNCNSTNDDLDKCESISYCVPCLSISECQAAASSTCEENANCPQYKSKAQCRNDCLWCPYDNDKCAFSPESDEECSSCDDFDTKALCDSHSNGCKWCSTVQHCLTIEDSAYCPNCSVVDENDCFKETTDGQCQFCTKQNKCLSTDEVCDESCQKASSESACTAAGADCAWCKSESKCFETRTECVSCKDQDSESKCKGYVGCTFCESGFCSEDKDKCPVCSKRGKDDCLFEQGIRLSCEFCNSSQTCAAKGSECITCDTIEDSDQCKEYKGCAYCKSDQVCKDSYENFAECECIGMAGMVCNAHPKGCCYSTKQSQCYEIGDSMCKDGLDTVTIIIISVCVGVAVIAAAILIPVLICCCKPKTADPIEMTAPGTIVVLPEGQPSMVVQESLASVNGVDPATAVSVDETNSNPAVAPAASVQYMQMQNMLAQQQMLNTMMMNQSMMMNPMMMNSMGMMNMSGAMSGMGGMAGMGGMNSMGMDMNSMGMTGGMNSMNMTGGMGSMGGMTSQPGVSPAAEGTV